jgi:hypothetical protein
MLTVAAGSYFWLAYGFSGFLGQLQNVAVVASLAAVALWAREALAWRRSGTAASPTFPTWVVSHCS